MAASSLDFGEVETFLDRHPELLEDYLMRKGKQELVDKWLQRHSPGQGASGLKHALAGTGSLAQGSSRGSTGMGGGAGPQGSANTHPMPGGGESAGVPLSPSWASGSRGDGNLQRKASQKELRKSFARSKAIHVNRTYDEQVTSRAQEPMSSVRRRALLRKASSLPPTTAHILSALLESRVNLPQYPPTAIDYKCHLKKHNERQFFLELVKDISNDLDLTSLSYKILIFVCLMVDADRCSLFLVEGAAAGKKSLVSKFFDVHAGTPLLPCSSTENSNEVQVPWGKGIIGYVGEHGETVNIPDAYQGMMIFYALFQGWKVKGILDTTYILDVLTTYSMPTFSLVSLHKFQACLLDAQSCGCGKMVNFLSPKLSKLPSPPHYAQNQISELGLSISVLCFLPLIAQAREEIENKTEVTHYVALRMNYTETVCSLYTHLTTAWASQCVLVHFFSLILRLLVFLGTCLNKPVSSSLHGISFCLQVPALLDTLCAVIRGVYHHAQLIFYALDTLALGASWRDCFSQFIMMCVCVCVCCILEKCSTHQLHTPNPLLSFAVLSGLSQLLGLSSALSPSSGIINGLYIPSNLPSQNFSAMAPLVFGIEWDGAGNWRLRTHCAREWKRGHTFKMLTPEFSERLALSPSPPSSYSLSHFSQVRFFLLKPSPSKAASLTPMWPGRDCTFFSILKSGVWNICLPFFKHTKLIVWGLVSVNPMMASVPAGKQIVFIFLSAPGCMLDLITSVIIALFP
ncbi:Pde11a [Phodopus roborovskii]|uniref:Pde11a protein n=1 Tax=Phodopus roborovskii TaxID=109678 RepID=A0AAU9Z8F7_PHORO|nr:Pde11a [Phodopus roborovskii]